MSEVVFEIESSSSWEVYSFHVCSTEGGARTTAAWLKRSVGKADGIPKGATVTVYRKNVFAGGAAAQVYAVVARARKKAKR